MEEVLQRFALLIGERHVLVDPDAMAPYTTDWRGRYRGDAKCVLRPRTTEEVSGVVRLCCEAGFAIVPQGGNTGLCGGATPISGEVVISLGRLARVRWVDAEGSSICVEAGCTLHSVQQAAAAVDRLFPLSLAAEGSATIGGNLSTNAGGVQVLRYGNARDLTLGLEVVLADGRVWNGLRHLRKDNTGYDLKHLFIGAEGTLGLITAATLKLFPHPRSHVTGWITIPDPLAAIHLLDALKAVAGDTLTAFEIVGRTALELVLRHIPNSRNPLATQSDWYLLVELSGGRDDLADILAMTLDQAIHAEQIADATVASNQRQAGELWALRENISEAQRIEGVSIKHDIAVPVSRIPEFIRRADHALGIAFPGVRIVCFGHVGDGNLHYNLSRSHKQANEDFLAQSEAVNRIVHDIVNDLGGSISAEHGIGQLKRLELLRYKSPLEMEVMRAIKNALDPAGILNPGKVL